MKLYVNNYELSIWFGLMLSPASWIVQEAIQRDFRTAPTEAPQVIQDRILVDTLKKQFWDIVLEEQKKISRSMTRFGKKYGILVRKKG